MRIARSALLLLLMMPAGCGGADPSADSDVRETPVYARIRAALDAVEAIDNHSHLHPRDQLPFKDPTPQGPRITLHSLWAGSYLPYIVELPGWPDDHSFDTWWKAAKEHFDDVRTAGFYRYMLPAFRDLYGADFDAITDEGVRALNGRVVENHLRQGWVREVVAERANIAMIIVDPFWSRLEPRLDYEFTAPLLSVHPLIHSSHPSKDPDPKNSPYLYARREGREIRHFNDYLATVRRIVTNAASAGAVGLKSTQAYARTLRFERVPKDRAAAAFGIPPHRITPQQQKDFEDYLMWYLAALSAEHDLPFQIHTGRAKPDGANPMLLMNLIAGNPRTRFVLLHGGYPWIDDMAVLAQTHGNVWVDTSWLPTLSYAVAKRGYQEWLECIPADRLLWGSDGVHPEGIYGATVLTRQCLAEALSEMVLRGDVREDAAIAIGRRILRDNALALYNRLRSRME